MSESTEIEPEEVVDGLPVLAEEPVGADMAEVATAPLAVRQAAAVAVGGFAAGAVTVAFVHRRRVKSVVKKRSRRKKGVIGEVIGSNSFLVDVHLLRRD